MRIRPAILEDIPALKIIRDTVRENALVTLRIEHEDYVKAFTLEGHAWTCDAKGVEDVEPVGFVCVRPAHRDVWALFVRADFEGRGIGNALMDIGEQWMFAHDVDEIHLSTEAGTRAERLYTRRGWQRQGVVRGEVVFTLRRRISLRRATVDDARAIGALHVASWQWAYRALVPQHFLDELDPLARGERWRELLGARIDDPRADPPERTWLAFDGAELVGFCDTAPSDDEPDCFEVRALYVAQRVAGRDVGARLLARALRDVEWRGAKRVALWVLASNQRARRFYEKHGFKPDGATKLDEKPGGPALFEVRYVRRR